MRCAARREETGNWLVARPPLDTISPIVCHFTKNWSTPVESLGNRLRLFASAGEEFRYFNNLAKVCKSVGTLPC